MTANSTTPATTRRGSQASREAAAAALRDANAKQLIEDQKERGVTATANAAAAKDAEVLNGVLREDQPETKPATPARRTRKAPATKTPAAKAPAKTPAKTPAKGKTPAKPAAPAKAASNGTKPEAGYRAYATKAIPPAMENFAKWIAREFPELGKVDPRVVTIASKAYRHFQSSDLNK